MALDEAKLNEFLGQVVGELGVAFSMALVLIGDELGLYRAMSGAGSLTSLELARRTGTDERLVREWLANQAAGGYVEYDPATGRFTLPDEHAIVLGDQAGPADLPGGFQIAASLVVDRPKVVEALRTGIGLDWGKHDDQLLWGTDRFFGAAYRASLVRSWMPALDDGERKLIAGARVADVGCGRGASTTTMAEAYPASIFVGYDADERSIEVARKKAADAGVADRFTFEVARASEYPGSGFDLVAVFDALHDMGDPAGAAAHILRSLDVEGTLMLVEPFAGDQLEENLNPVGRLFYAGSTMICVPGSLAQEGAAALGNQAGEKRLRDVVTAAGFTRFRRAVATPFNLILEARP